MKILAIDLGKFKSVACLFDTETNQAESETIAMQQVILEDLLQRKQPQKVVIETCTNSNWVDDICQEHGYEVGCQSQSRSLAISPLDLQWSIEATESFDITALSLRQDKPHRFAHAFSLDVNFGAEAAF